MNWPWSVLGLPGPSGLPEIRRAYARKLKTTHPEDDPEGFQRLHDAYQQACRIARQKQQGPIPSAEEPPKPRRTFPETPQSGGGTEEIEHLDYGELLKGGQSRKSAQKGPDTDGGQDSEAENWDYDELLKDGQRRKSAQKGPDTDGGQDSEAENWDYDELLKGGQSRKSAQKGPDTDGGQDSEAENWDYDELLKDGQRRKSAQKGPEEEPGGEPEEESGEEATRDWDYERLFAEGEEEARAAQRKKIEELREKNRARIAAQEKEQRRRAEDDEETWSAVMAATHALELLLSTGAPLPRWREFLNSPVFWNVKANLDFIFALEDFLEQNPDLPLSVRKAFYTAYGFERTVPPECRRLSRLLHLGRKDRRKLRWKNSPFRKQWQSWPARRRFATVFSLIFLGILSLTAVWSLLEDGIFQKTPWQETMCEQLEKDYGRRFIHPYEDGEYIFAPEDEPNLLFFAYEDGDGYQTNYPERMVMDQIQQFSEKWNLPLEYDSAGEGYRGQLGETPGAYILQMPLEGKGESITELGDILESLKMQRWYQPRVPDFELFLSYGNLHFYKFRSTEEDFDADYARVLYETKFGPELCRYIAENSGMAEADLGKDAYVLLERGSVTVDGQTFFWCAGMSKPPDSAPLRHYLLSAEGGQIFSVSNRTMEAGFDLDDLYQGVRNIQILPELGSHASLESYTLQ